MEGDTTRLYVVSSTGRTFAVEVELRQDSIESLKAKIKGKEGIPISSQRLFLRGWTCLEGHPPNTLLSSFDFVPDDVVKVVSTEGPGGRTTGPFFRQWIRRVFPADESKLSSSLAIGIEFLPPEGATSDPGRPVGQKGEVDLSSIDSNNLRLFVGRYSEHNLRGRETLYASIKGDIVRDTSARTVWFVPTEPLPPSSEGTVTWLTAYLSPRVVDADGHVLKPNVRFRSLPETHPDRYQGFLDDFAWRFQTNDCAITRHQQALPVRNAYGSTQSISQEVENRLVIDPTLARLVTSAVNLGFDRERVYACLRARPTTQINVLISNLKSGIGASTPSSHSSSSASVPPSSTNITFPPTESLHMSPTDFPLPYNADSPSNPYNIDPEVLARQQKKLAMVEESNTSHQRPSGSSGVSQTNVNRTLTSSDSQVRILD